MVAKVVKTAKPKAVREGFVVLQMDDEITDIYDYTGRVYGTVAEARTEAEDHAFGEVDSVYVIAKILYKVKTTTKTEVIPFE